MSWTASAWADPRGTARARRRWAVVWLIIMMFLLPWLFIQNTGLSVRLRTAGENEALDSITAVVPVSDQQALVEWWPDIVQAAQETGVPALLIATIMLHESGGNPQAAADKSNPLAGAYGLMQLEPAAAARLPGYYPGARENPQTNLLLGAELLKANAHLFGGNWLYALAAYYGGHYAVDSGVTANTPWPEGAQLLNIVPCSTELCYKENDGITMTTYVNTIIVDMAIVSKWQKTLALSESVVQTAQSALPNQQAVLGGLGIHTISHVTHQELSQAVNALLTSLNLKREFVGILVKAGITTGAAMTLWNAVGTGASIAEDVASVAVEALG